MRWKITTKLICLVLSFGWHQSALAQNAVGIGTDNPNPHAVLELKSTGQQGFQMPRLDAADTASFGTLGPPDRGLMFYDTTSAAFFYFNGNAWQSLSTGGGGEPSGQFFARVDSAGNILSQKGNTFSVTRITTGRYEVSFDSSYTALNGLSITPQSALVNSTPTGYCLPNHLSGCSFGDYIQNFTLGSINNNSGCSGGDYGDFTALSTTLTAGSTVPVSAVCNDEDGIGIWIDFDQDGTFNSSDEYVFSSDNFSPAGVTQSGNITIPATALNGPTRLRIRCSFFCKPPSTVPCNSNSCLEFGETEDYTVEITGGVPSGTPSPVVPVYSNLSGSGFTCTTFDINGNPVDAGFSFTGQGD